jgi:hypothetical protein
MVPNELERSFLLKIADGKNRLKNALQSHVFPSLRRYPPLQKITIGEHLNVNEARDINDFSNAAKIPSITNTGLILMRHSFPLLSTRLSVISI